MRAGSVFTCFSLQKSEICSTESVPQKSSCFSIHSAFTRIRAMCFSRAGSDLSLHCNCESKCRQALEARLSSLQQAWALGAVRKGAHYFRRKFFFSSIATYKFSVHVLPCFWWSSVLTFSIWPVPLVAHWNTYCLYLLCIDTSSWCCATENLVNRRQPLCHRYLHWSLSWCNHEASQVSWGADMNISSNFITRASWSWLQSDLSSQIPAGQNTWTIFCVDNG